MWVPSRPEFGVWGSLPIGEVRQRVRRTLPELVLADPRLHRREMTEYTLQAIIYEHVSWLMGRQWRVRVEDFIPGTNQRADLIIERLTRDLEPDLTSGVIALEVKPNGGMEGLLKDIRKLRRYVEKSACVNCGILLYLSSREAATDRLRRTIGSCARKVFVTWLRRRKEWS